MKQQLNIFTRLFVVAVVAILTMGTMAQGQLLTNENFDYSTGQLTNVNGGGNVSGGNWVSYSGTTLPLQVTSGSLTFTGYASSGVGNKVVTQPGSAEDAYRQFTTQTTGTVYFGFLLNVTSTTGMVANTSTTGDYSFALTPSNSTSALNARVSVRVGSVAGTYNLGLRASSSNTTSTFKSTDYATGVTHLIVVSYQIVDGATNDIVKMWIDPAIGGSESTSDLSQTAGIDLADVARMAIRQGTNSVNSEVDGIRIGTTWESVTGATGDANSDIVAAGNETSNIDYASFQLGAIGATTDAVKVWSFTIRDGGGAADADALPTILTGVTIDKGGIGNPSWASTIRQAALYNGSTEVGEVSVTGETISFSGLSLSTPDDGSTTLDLYLTFETSATDNSQYQFQITNANVTAQGFNASTFSAFSAQTSSTTSDANRVEVTASKLTFTTNPAASVAQNVNFAAAVTAYDVNNNVDLDFTGNVTVGVQTGTGAVSSVAGLTQAAASGVASWSDLRYNTAETGVQLDANSGVLTEGVSSSFDVVGLSAASDIVAGPNSDLASFSSLIDSQGEQVEVYDITIRDGGGSADGDAVGTIVDQIVFGQSGANTAADWSQYIQGVELFNGLTSLGTGTVGATTLTFSGSPLVATTDGGSVDLQLKVYLNTSMPAGAEGIVLGFKVNQNTDVTTNSSGSLFAAGGSDVAGSSAISVVATQLGFGANIANQTSGVAFATSVKATDVNGNLDEDYASTVTLSISSGSGALSGTTSGAASGGTASFSGVIVTGSGDHVLDAGDGSLLTSSNIFNVVLPAAPAVFKIANYTPPLKSRTVSTVDTLDWDDANSWTQISGNDLNNIPDGDDDVILDNTFKSGSYVLLLANIRRDTVKTLTIGYAGNTNTIEALIPSTSTLSSPLRIGDGVAGNHDLLILQGGVLNNRTTTTSSTAIFVVGFSSPARDTMTIRSGGTLIHASKTGTTYMFRGSQAKDGDYGTFIFDVPDSNTTYAAVATSGAWYPNLIYKSTNAGGKKAYKPSNSTGFGDQFVKGNLTIEAGVTDTVGGVFNEALELHGDLINYGTLMSVASSWVEFAGSDQQEISGNPVTFYNGFVMNNPNGVALQTNVTVAGGTATFTNGDMLTVTNSVSLDPAGTLLETNGTIKGTVTATRTLSQSVNNTFGDIGMEINALSAAPGVTTVNRTTGTFLTGNDNQSIRRFFDVTTAGTPPFNATVVLKYAESELNGNDEATLFLHKSTDGGTTWSGKGGTPNTSLNKVTTTGINTFSRFTLASSSTPLYATHTITMRKYEDADGDLGTAGTLKKWYMELYENSIAPENLVNSGNFNTVTTENLAAGMYIAKEADSSGWVHVGTIVDNGSGAVSRYGSHSYDTIVVGGAVPGTVDFYNSRVSSITINKYRDRDGDAGTTGDQTAKEWGLALYKDAVSGSPIAEGNTSSLVVENLAGGTYIAVEADSAGWFPVGGSNYDTVTIASNENVTINFYNVKANTLTVRKYQDDDGDPLTVADQTLKSWYLEVHSGSASGPVVFSGTASSISNSMLADGMYYVTEADSTPWVSLGFKVDGVYAENSAGQFTGSVELLDGQSSTFDFFNAPAIYGSKFRTFNPDSIATARDNFGKMGKVVKKKADKVEFVLYTVNDQTGVNALHMEFTVAVDTAKEFYTEPTSSAVEVVKSGLKKWNFTFNSPLNNGDTVRVYGWGKKGSIQKVGKYYWMNGTTKVGVDKKNPTFTLNQLRLPMPNRINVAEETFVQGAFTATNGMLIGARTDSAKAYGWVIMKKAGDLLTSLGKPSKDIVNFHDSAAHGFDRLSNGKVFLGKKTSLPAKTQDNVLFANLAALKLSIAASALEKTPIGLGELILADTQANVLNDMTLAQIAVKGDSMMSGGVGRTFESADAFANLSNTIRRVLDAFEGDMDTVTFGSKLVTKGAQRLIDCTILRANPTAIPARIIPTTENILPETYALYQNYPNPFNPATTIAFDLPFVSNVTLKIYNILGQEVATLLDKQELEEGAQELSFDAANFSSGVYLYRITAESVDEDGISNTFTSVKKMVLMK
ncbi:MAG: T9SS type A sorting domain-containing protein [Ignavibacteriae bacterium]|nr:T9SS type A sorting domain-containing protein [Ignavibacteriota bacterium]